MPTIAKPYYLIEKKDLIPIQESVDELRKEVQELKELLAIIANQATQVYNPLNQRSDDQIFYDYTTTDKYWFKEPMYKITC